jgi:membrane protease subunit (stomatin/prohibitin family)
MAIIEVVKYNGGPDVFAWKYPNEELGTWTQLIVNESQEVILFKGGKALDTFQSGRHTLETANIPFLNKIVNLPFGGRSPFTAEIWYINKLYNLDIKWGTASPIQIQDPKYGVFIPIRSNGLFGIRIEDSKQFLIKLVGTLSVFNKESIVKYFRGLYITKVKDAISTYLIKKEISVMEINAYIDELSEFLKERIQPTMAEFGINLTGFYVNDISIPEDDSAVIKLKNALAKKAEMNIIGYDYQQERSFDTMEGAASNSGSNSAPIMGAGLGLGMGLGLGGPFGNAFGTMTKDFKFEHKVEVGCPKCQTMVPQGQRFCGQCGYDITTKVEEKKKLLCSNCNAELKPGMKFCTECGNKYNPCPSCGADMKDGAEECIVCGKGLPKRCSKCSSLVPSNVKFCPECGEALVNHCPKCSATFEDKPKFCPECGEKLN